MSTLTQARARAARGGRPSGGGRRQALLVAVLLLVAVVLQATWLARTTGLAAPVAGAVPDLVLVVVVVVALLRGPSLGALVGFAGGLLLDLAPPADHLAGRWALALVVAGYLAGLVRTEVLPGGLGPSGREGGPGAVRWTTVVATTAACSFVAASVFGLTGLLLDDAGVGVPSVLRAVLTSVVLDTVVAVVAGGLLLRWLTSGLRTPASPRGLTGRAGSAARGDSRGGTGEHA